MQNAAGDFLFLKGPNFLNKVGNVLLSAATLWSFSNLLHKEEQEEHWNTLLMENPKETVVIRGYRNSFCYSKKNHNNCPARCWFLLCNSYVRSYFVNF